MGRIWFWTIVVLIVMLCRHYSFWAVFGWAYATASMALIVVCFARNCVKENQPQDEQPVPVLAGLTSEER